MSFYSTLREMSRPTNEDTVLDDEEVTTAAPDTEKKNYDRFSEAAPDRTKFFSGFPSVEVVRRRGRPPLADLYHPAIFLRLSLDCQPTWKSLAPGSDRAASTLHRLFKLDVELKPKLDLSELHHEKVGILGATAQGTRGSGISRAWRSAPRLAWWGLP